MAKHTSLFKKAELLERMALFGVRGAFLKSLAETDMGPGMTEFVGQDVEGEPPTPDYTKPETEAKQMHSEKVFKPLAFGAHINPEVQKALFLLYPDTMKGSTVDGIFGTRTQSGMNRWKADKHDNRALADETLQRDIVTSAGLSGMKAASNRALQEKYGF